mmetsp:Transcript_2632/g.6802  ORF Transcript_2632/g.6802 Transcript_2632/m.6802 type:complete len:335 (-) Transcript_2632:1292-2296(-)
MRGPQLEVCGSEALGAHVVDLDFPRPPRRVEANEPSPLTIEFLFPETVQRHLVTFLVAAVAARVLLLVGSLLLGGTILRREVITNRVCCNYFVLGLHSSLKPRELCGLLLDLPRPTPLRLFLTLRGRPRALLLGSALRLLLSPPLCLLPLLISKPLFLSLANDRLRVCPRALLLHKHLHTLHYLREEAVADVDPTIPLVEASYLGAPSHLAVSIPVIQSLTQPVGQPRGVRPQLAIVDDEGPLNLLRERADRHRSKVYEEIRLRTGRLGTRIAQQVSGRLHHLHVGLHSSLDASHHLSLLLKLLFPALPPFNLSLLRLQLPPLGLPPLLGFLAR